MVCWEGDLGGCCCFGLGEGYCFVGWVWVGVLGGHFVVSFDDIWFGLVRIQRWYVFGQMKQKSVW